MSEIYVTSGILRVISNFKAQGDWREAKIRKMLEEIEAYCGKPEIFTKEELKEIDEYATSFRRRCSVCGNYDC